MLLKRSLWGSPALCGFRRVSVVFRTKLQWNLPVRNCIFCKTMCPIKPVFPWKVLASSGQQVPLTQSPSPPRQTLRSDPRCHPSLHWWSHQSGPFELAHVCASRALVPEQHRSRWNAPRLSQGACLTPGDTPEALSRALELGTSAVGSSCLWVSA